MRRDGERTILSPFCLKMVVSKRRVSLDIRSKLQAPRTTYYRLIHLSPIPLPWPCNVCVFGAWCDGLRDAGPSCRAAECHIEQML